MAYGPKPRPIGERFWEKVARAEDGCWEWRASRQLNGYGRFALTPPKRMEGAHRVAYVLSKGPIPSGMVVMHSCDNRGCCRPDHLTLGTVADNNADTRQKARHPHGPTHGSRTHPAAFRQCRQCGRFGCDLHGEDGP